MRILLWHVHGSWTTGFVQGSHHYLLPVLPDRGPDGLGRARTWDWPSSVAELPPGRLPDQDIDVVILQRPNEIELTHRWTGRRPGVDLPAVYVEHNTPDQSACRQRHWVADRTDIPIAHVTAFNQLYWDNGSAPNTVIEHGIVDPGPRYSGEMPIGAVVLNDAHTRGRVVGADLIPRFADYGPVDLFGMHAEDYVNAVGTTRHPIRAHQRIRTQDQMHTALARRRVYLHPPRWTSLGLSLIEAMHLGMPVLALAATATTDAVPADAGLVSLNVARLGELFRTLLHEPEVARFMGERARQAALRRFGLHRFLTDWEQLLSRVTSDHHTQRAGYASNGRRVPSGPSRELLYEQ